MIAIVLAAGKSTRMQTSRAKVLHEVCGVPMLDYVLSSCRQAGADKIYIVVGYGKEQIVEKHCGQHDLVFVEQAEQKGTAHAVLCCRKHIADYQGRTLILCGDGPLIKSSTLTEIAESHEKAGNALTLGTAILDDPFGYGRIIRNSQGTITAIVEHVECDETQLEVKEVNPSYLCFDNQTLFSVLDRIKPSGVKGEYYLTDAISLILKEGSKVSALDIVAPEEAQSVNSREQLSDINTIMQKRIQDILMAEGVTIVNPANTWIEFGVVIGVDTIIEPFVHISRGAVIGSNCLIKSIARIKSNFKLKDDSVYPEE